MGRKRRLVIPDQGYGEADIGKGRGSGIPFGGIYGSPSTQTTVEKSSFEFSPFEWFAIVVTALVTMGFVLGIGACLVVSVFKPSLIPEIKQLPRRINSIDSQVKLFSRRCRQHATASMLTPNSITKVMLTSNENDKPRLVALQPYRPLQQDLVTASLSAELARGVNGGSI